MEVVSLWAVTKGHCQCLVVVAEDKEVAKEERDDR